MANDLYVFIRDLEYNEGDDVIAYYSTYCASDGTNKYTGGVMNTMSLPGSGDGAQSLNLAMFTAVENYAENNCPLTFGPTDRRFLSGRIFVPPVLSQSSASRSLNSAYQISALRNALVSYSVEIECTLTVSGGETGTVFLEIADDSGFTTNVQELCRSVNGNSGTLTIGLSLTQTLVANVEGVVPGGKYVRLRTDNTAGTPTFTYRSGQETLN